jgi:hypothetical protein
LALRRIAMMLLTATVMLNCVFIVPPQNLYRFVYESNVNEIHHGQSYP